MRPRPLSPGAGSVLLLTDPARQMRLTIETEREDDGRWIAGQSSRVAYGESRDEATRRASLGSSLRAHGANLRRGRLPSGLPLPQPSRLDGCWRLLRRVEGRMIIGLSQDPVAFRTETGGLPPDVRRRGLPTASPGGYTTIRVTAFDVRLDRKSEGSTRTIDDTVRVVIDKQWFWRRLVVHVAAHRTAAIGGLGRRPCEGD